MHDEELGDEGIARQQWHCIIGEDGIGVGSTVPNGEIHDILLVGRTILWQILTHIYIVGNEVGISRCSSGIIIRCSSRIVGQLRDDDHGHVCSADILYGISGSTLRTEPVELRRCLGRNHHVSGTSGDIVNEMACHWYLSLGFLGERHSYGVANAVGKQCTNTHGTLDTSVLTLTGFGHSQMERIVHVLLVHLAHQQAHGAHHHHRVAGLDGDDYIIEILLFAYTKKLHTALHDTLGSVAIARHDTVGKRTMVYSDANGSVILLAYIEEGDKSLLQSLEFGGIFLVGIFKMLECAGRVDIITGIHPHLLGIECSHIGNIRIEMHVGNKGCRDTLGTKCGIDILEILSLAHTLCGEAHILATSLNDSLGLGYRSLGVGGGSGGHRLYAYGVVASHRGGAHVVD